jgi:hypothetical protein
MNDYMVEFVNKATGKEGVLLDGLTKREAELAYKLLFGKWFLVEFWYGPERLLRDRPMLWEF